VNKDDLKEGQKVTVTRSGRTFEAVVAKDAPYNEKFPFVLVRLESGNLLVNRNEIDETFKE
jgi:hypothetical protein